MERANFNLSQWLWWTERDSVLLAYYDASTDKFTSITEAGKKVNLLYIQRPDKFLVPGEAPERDGFTPFATSSTTGTYLGTELDSNTKVTDTTYLLQECEIPEQFHEALIQRVIANGYERKAETIPLSQHFHMKYEQGLNQAKNYSYRGRDGSKQVISPMDF